MWKVFHCCAFPQLLISLRLWWLGLFWENEKSKPNKMPSLTEGRIGPPPPGPQGGWGRGVREVEGRLSPGSLDETHSSPRCCSGPWAWWPARRCAGRTQPLSFHTARRQTRGCSRGTLWTAASYGSRWQPSRNWPEETKQPSVHCKVLRRDPKPLTLIFLKRHLF